MHPVEAAAWLARARAAQAEGNLAAAIECLRHAASLFASIEEPDVDDLMARGAACRDLGEILSRCGRAPEAMQAYQEACDAFEQAPGAEEDARRCARLVVTGVREIWREPQQRLYLLIARHERDQRQAAEEPGSEGRQADIALRIGAIFERRDRPEEAIPRYREALFLYERAPDGRFGMARCHHRLGGLYIDTGRDRGDAISHLSSAARLYEELLVTDPEVGAPLEACRRLIAALGE